MNKHPINWRKVFDGWVCKCTVTEVRSPIKIKCTFTLPVNPKQPVYGICELNRVYEEGYPGWQKESLRDWVADRILGNEFTMRIVGISVCKFRHPIVELTDKNGESINDWINEIKMNNYV